MSTTNLNLRATAVAEGATTGYAGIDEHVHDVPTPRRTRRPRTTRPNPDFIKASQRLTEVRNELGNSGHSLSTRPLSIKQQGLLIQCEKDLKSILGTRVVIFGTDDDTFSSSSPILIGVIVNISIDTNKRFRFNVEAFRAGQRSGWPLEYLHLFQIEQLTDEFLASSEDLAKIQIDKLLERVNQAKNLEYKRKEQNIEDYKSRIRSYQADIENYKISLEKTEKELGSIKLNNLNFKELEKKFKELRKHAKLEDAWLTNNNTIYMQTKMLMPITRVRQVEGKKEIGRFIIRVSYNNSSPELRAHNMNYNINGLDHPNVSSGSFCGGTHQTVFMEFMKNFELYGLFDSIITFLTLWPHDSGSNPYMSYTEWLRTRRASLVENPFNNFGEERLWPTKK